MTYKAFKEIEDKKRELCRREMESLGNAAYNRGLWEAVKWNPSKWLTALILMRK